MLTLFLAVESIVGSIASTVCEFLATIALRVEVPFGCGTWTATTTLGQQAEMFARVFLTSVFAFGFGLEAIVIATTAAIPETRTTSIVGVEVVLDAKVAAGALILGKTTGLLQRLSNILTTTELGIQCLCNTVGTTTVFGLHASATLEVGSLGNGLAILTALELGLGTMAALVLWSRGEGEAIGTATELHCLARATLELGSLGSGDLVGTATILRSFTWAALLLGSTCGCFLVGTTAVGRVGTLTTLCIRSPSRTNIVRAASIRGIDTATLALWSMSGCLVVWAATERFCCACSTSLSIGSWRRGTTIRTTSELRTIATLAFCGLWPSSDRGTFRTL